MSNYWQMTIREFMQDSFQPTRKLLHFGVYHFDCPVCGECVGIWRDPKFDPVDNGMMFKYEQCKNGHVVDWSMVKETE